MKKKFIRPRFKLTKSFYKFFTFGVVMYIGFLIAIIPANAVYTYFMDASPQAKGIRLSGVSGTVWSGLAGDANIKGIRLGKLEWELHFIPLLIGKMSFDIKFKSLTAQGHGAVATSFGGSVYAHNLEIRAPLGLIAPLMYGFPVSLDGQLIARIEDLEIDKGSRINAKGRIVVSNAASIAPQRIDVGDLLIKLDPDDVGSRINISDQGGPLLLQGNIQLKGNGQYSTNVTLAPRESASTALVQSLKFLGRADGAGKHYFRNKGKLRGW